MPTLKEITDDILATINDKSDDSSLDERLIHQWIKNSRAMLIRQQLEKRSIHSLNYLQHISCLQFELVDKSLSDCCSNLSIGCNVLRSTIQIPKLVSFKGIDTFNLRPLNVTQSKLNVVSHDSWIYSGNGRYNGNDIFATMIDRYVYVKSKDSVLQNYFGRYAYLEGIFEDPEQLANINDCNENQCYSDEMEYPIDQWMIDIIKEQIFKSLNININVKEDNQNNANSSKTEEA